MPLSRLFVAGALAISASVTGTLHAITLVGPWVIFFDSGSTEFDELDRRVLDNVADAWKSWPKPPPRLKIMAYTDRVGATAHNLTLSCARAKAVRDHLISKDIPSDQLLMTGGGENAPWPQTEDGVAEPQNRRAEIHYASDKNEHLPDGVIHC